MKKIYFPPRKKSRAGIIIAFSLVFLLAGAVITFMNKDKALSLTGMAVYNRPFDEDTFFCESCGKEVLVQAYEQLSKENTKEGLILNYGELKQEPIEMGIPVKWVRELQVSNPRAEPVSQAEIELEVPPDAFNVQVFMFGTKLSEGRVLEIPYFAPYGDVKMELVFETVPIFVEFVEEAGGAFPRQISFSAFREFIAGKRIKVIVWHNSSMSYYNVPVEMDIKLGEKIVELSDGTEQNIEFDYNAGKARWVIGNI